MAAVLAALTACTTEPEPSQYQGGLLDGVLEQSAGADPIEAGNALMRAGEYSLALRSFNRALAADGVSVQALVGAGSANERLGRLPQAERLLRAALDVDPTEVVAWNNLGVVLQRLDDFTGAETAFRMAFALNSGGDDAIRSNLNQAMARSRDEVAPDFEGRTNGLVPLGHGRYVLGNTTEG